MSSEESRHVTLNGQALDYRLRRSSRRTIGLRIDGHGLLLSVPLRTGEREIQSALNARADWIFKHLNARPAATAPLDLSDGASVLYLGQPHVVQISTGRAGVDHQPCLLQVSLPSSSKADALGKQLERWYKRQALHHFSERVHVYARQLNLPLPPVSLTSAKTRWGSCNHKGEIRLHWRLMQASPALIDYVIAHELAHLLELNHSPRFWAHVERVYPHWRQSRDELKKIGQQFWTW